MKDSEQTVQQGAPGPRTRGLQRIGRYEVVDFLGAGGMAEVWLCRRVGVGGFDKPVVIKRILPAFTEDDNFVRMFLDEARLAARLNHPNVVQVYDIDMDGDTPFIAMEYLRGWPFAKVLKHGRQSDAMIGQSVRILSDVAAGLHYAHNVCDDAGEPMGIVHRDVSPHNILVTTDGMAKILDFGIAKSRDRLSTTQSGTLKGKISYMAPEQARMENAVDHRADVFSLGVCLYQATTGRLPFSGDSEVQTLMQLIASEYKLPSTFIPDYPKALEELIVSALATDVDKRCPTALQFQEQLDAFATGLEPKPSHSVVKRFLEQTLPPQRTPALPRGAGLTPTTQSGDIIFIRDEDVQTRVTTGGHLQGVGPGQVVPPPPAGLRKHTRKALIAAAVLGVGVTGWLVTHTRHSEPAPVKVSELHSVRAFVQDKRYDDARRVLASVSIQGLSEDEQREFLHFKQSLAAEEALRAARKHLANGDAQEAITHARRVLTLDPSNQDAVQVINAASSVAPPVATAVKSAPTVQAPEPSNSKKRSRNRGRTMSFDADGLLPTDADSLLPPDKGR